MKFGFSSSDDTVTGNSSTPMPSTTRPFFTFPPEPSSTLLSSLPCDSTSLPVAGSTVTTPSWLCRGSFVSTAASTDTATMPWFTNASSSTATSSSSVSAITTATVTATSTSTVSATEFATVPDSCPPEQDEVAAILARQCEKFLSYPAARPAQGRGENERHAWVFGATGFESTSSNKPIGDAAHIPAATAEQKYAESKPCSVPSLQPAEEEEPYFPPVDLLDSTIDMWVRVVANKKLDRELREEGLCHFYEGINYFCLLSERLQVVTDKYNKAVKARDELEKACRKLEDSERERLEHEVVQMIFHQKIFELTKELKEAIPAAIQKYKASSLYRQELMDYAAPYMGKGVKLAVEKIKAKDPMFDPKTYGLEMYILPPEAD